MSILGDIGRILGQLCGIGGAYLLIRLAREFSLVKEPDPMHSSMQMTYLIACFIFFMCTLFLDKILYLVGGRMALVPPEAREFVPRGGEWKKSIVRGVAGG